MEYYNLNYLSKVDINGVQNNGVFRKLHQLAVSPSEQALLGAAENK